MSNPPMPRYSLWQAISTSLAVGLRAIEEVRAISRERGEKGERGESGEQGPPGLPGAAGEKGDPGERGEAAYAGTARGLWNDKERYRAMDVVAFNGSEWRAVCDDPGPLPGDGWKQGAKGVKGKPGERGERGEKGERGVSGPEGRGIVDLFMTEDGEELVVMFSDGTQRSIPMVLR